MNTNEKHRFEAALAHLLGVKPSQIDAKASVRPRKAKTKPSASAESAADRHESKPHK